MCGSFFGSLAYILRFRIYEHDGIVAAFFGNAIIAALFSPTLVDVICPRTGLVVSFRSCLFISSAIALSVPWFFRAIAPKVQDKLEHAAGHMNIVASIARVLGYVPDERKSRKKSSDE